MAENSLSSDAALYVRADTLIRSAIAAEVAQGLSLLSENAAENPEDAWAQFEYAGAFDFLGREDEALVEYRRTLALGIDTLPEAERPRFYLQFGSTLGNGRLYDESAAALREGIARYPGMRALRAFLGLTEYSRGNFRESARLFLQSTIPEAGDESVADYSRALRFYLENLDSYPVKNSVHG